MTPPDAATRHVVERCPACGVEHETSDDVLCEACDTPLRAWCRRHGRETGWLDAAACPRCVEEAAPRPPAAAAARTRPPKKKPSRRGKRAEPPPPPPALAPRMTRRERLKARLDRPPPVKAIPTVQETIRDLMPLLLALAGGATGALLIGVPVAMVAVPVLVLAGLIVYLVSASHPR